MNFIVCSDVHLAATTPCGRTDENYLKTSLGKLEQVLRAAYEDGMEVVIAGDLFEKSCNGPNIMNPLIDLLTSVNSVKVTIVPGNHDLKERCLDNLKESSIWGLRVLPNVNIVEEPSHAVIGGNKVDLFPWSSKLENLGGDIAIIHEFAWAEKPWKDASRGGNFKKLAKKLGPYQTILSGDNHKAFSAMYRNTTFVNCGGMLRKGIHEQDHDPCFYVVGDRVLEPISLEVQEDPFDHEAAEMVNLKDDAIEEAVAMLGDDESFGLNYEDNMNAWIDGNKPEEEITAMIRKAMK